MKTIEEAAKEYANIPIDRVIDEEERYFNSNVIYYDAFNAGAEFAQRWIPVEEELPIINEDTQSSDYVLILVDNRHWIKGFFYNGKWYISGFLVHNVTHWRPLEVK